MKSVGTRFLLPFGLVFVLFSLFVLYWIHPLSRQSLILVAGFALLFALLVFAFRFAVSRRLTAMTRHFDRLASFPGGPKLSPVEIRGNDEIGLLGKAFNRLVGELQNAQASLESHGGQRAADLARANEEMRREIAERKRADEALRQSQGTLQALMDALPVAIGWANLNGSIEYMNRKFRESFGYTLDEIPTLEHWYLRAFPDPAYREALLLRWNTAVAKARSNGGEVAAGEARITCRDGSIRYAAIAGTVVGDRIMASFTDLTERKKTEEDLRASEERFSTLMSHLPAGVFIKDAEDRLLFANAYLQNLFGWKNSVGKTTRELLPAEIAERMVADDKKTLAQGLQVVTETISDSQGRERVFETSKFPIPVGEGKLLLGGIALEITARDRMEKALRESEELHRRLVATLPDIIIRTDISGRIVFTNDVAARLSGSTPVEEFIGKNIFSFISPCDIERAMENARQMFEKPLGPKEYKLTLREGLEIDCEVNGDVLRDAQGTPYGIVLVLRDLTERKRAEDSLRESEERYRLLVETSPLGIVFIDSEGNIRNVNSRIMSILGAPPGEPVQGFNLLTSPFLVESGISANFHRCLQTGKSGIYEVPFRSRWGKEAHLRYHLTPIRDLTGRITGAQAIVEDITDRKKLEGQLLQSQKMEAIGTLAGGIAHDFNNILTAILGYAELAVFEIPKNSPGCQKLQQSIRSAHRAKDLVKQILAFSRQSKEERKTLDIRPLIQEGLKLIRASLPSTIEIRENLDADLGMIEADPTQIQQVLMNLCTNAGHAMSENGGVLEVSLTPSDIASDRFDPNGGPEPGPYVRLRVSDTGHGMTPKVLQRIYEPYFTTKEVGKGTGLGLSVVHGIVAGYRGGITVASEPGKGTVFDVYFPRVEATAAPPEAVPAGPIPLGRGERVLFVDDEKTIVEIGQQMLQRLQYEVVIRTSSVEALELFRTRPDRFDLVITDMTMPNMTGRKLAQEVLQIRPDIPIILCTGFSEQVTEEIAQSIGIREFIMKPLVMRDLAQVVRRALAKT